MSNFSEADIVPLDPIDHVRLRPNMYFGGTDKRALHQLVYDVVDEAVDEAIAGSCNHIEVTLQKNNAVSISDNGAGISVKVDERSGSTVLELIMRLTIRSYDRTREIYTSGGLHGVVGIGAVNAVSKEFLVQVRRNGYLWQQTYSERLRSSDLTQLRPLEPGESNGTTITFTPDFSIFQSNEFSYHALARRLRELAYLVPGLTLTLKDQREQPEGAEVSFHYPNGLADFVTHLNRKNIPIHSIIHARGDVEIKTLNGQPYMTGVEVAFQYVEQPSGFSLSYANTHESTYGGTHVEGLLQALRWYFGVHIKLDELDEPDMNGVDEVFVSQGLTAVIHIMHPYARPVYEGEMRGRLVEPEIRHAVYEVASKAIGDFAEQHPDDMQRLVDHFFARKQERDKRRFGE